MATPRMPQETGVPQLDRVLNDEAPLKGAGVAPPPSYKVVGESKIPVSKHYGSIWQGRRDAGLKTRKHYEESWDEAIRYYNNDQLAHRQQGAYESSGNVNIARRMNDTWSETENVVFANTTTLLPAIYAKNPEIETTPSSDQDHAFGVLAKRLIDALFNVKEAPGINLKPKVRRTTLMACLTNKGWIEIGWNPKSESSEQALQDLQTAADDLAKPDLSTTDIMVIEGRLHALEKHVSILSPAGPFALSLSPYDIVVDPESVESDHSDANWIMKRMYLRTDYLNARYGEKDPESGEVRSKYEPTHIMSAKGSGGGVDDLVKNFSLFPKDGGEPGQYGYQNQEALDDACRTMVWMCWDKTTRRVFLYADNKWEWPLWVWDDPYKLLRFYPFFNLQFYENPNGPWAKGEVTYYLDQQDAINEINDEARRARWWVKRHIIFNENYMDQEDVEKWMKGPDGAPKGMRWPEGMKLSDMIGAVSPPMTNFMELFNKEGQYAAIDRISSVYQTLRGVQFKTNTTNRAIDTYNSATQTRLDEKIDAIEDFIGDIGWNLLQICVYKMDADTVRTLVGPEIAATYPWRNMEPRELNNMVETMRVVGGSTAKPTSRQKKEEAIEAGQVLGQFADAAPGVVTVLMAMFRKAFGHDILRDEDWDFIMKSMMMQQQQAGAGPQGTPAGAAPPNGAAPPDAVAQLMNAGLLPPAQAGGMQGGPPEAPPPSMQ